MENKGTQNPEDTTKPIKTMKSIYLEKDKSMAYFIGSYKEDEEEFVGIDNAAAIEKSAFAHSDVKKILLNSSPNVSPKSIGEKAFEGCESLTTVIFGELENDALVADKATLKNLTLAPAGGNFTIQANAFKDCAKLATLVLPKVEGKNNDNNDDSDKKLVIEKDAFCGCGALRTVVALCDKAEFTGNPFASSPEHLTFVCKKDSDVARFARENGYRSVYVEQ